MRPAEHADHADHANHANRANHAGNEGTCKPYDLISCLSYFALVGGRFEYKFPLLPHHTKLANAKFAPYRIVKV